HAFAIGNLADGEAFHDAAAGAGDHDAFIGLQAFLVAFADLDPDLDGVAMGEFGEFALCGQRGDLLGFELFDNIAHFRSVRSFRGSDSFRVFRPRRPVLVGNGRAVFLVLPRAGPKRRPREWAAHRRKRGKSPVFWAAKARGFRQDLVVSLSNQEVAAIALPTSSFDR